MTLRGDCNIIRESGITSRFLLSDTVSASFLYDLLFCKTINLSVSQFLSSWMWQYLLIAHVYIKKKMKFRENKKDILKSFKLTPYFPSNLLYEITIQNDFFLSNLIERNLNNP